jgi:transmembrane 9 superfamily protein 2/4
LKFICFVFCLSFVDFFSEENKLKMTYEVEWTASETRWASRWDTYLAMTDVQIHWFSIVNSVIVVFFLAGILSMIIVKTLRRDIARYNQEDAVSLKRSI